MTPQPAPLKRQLSALPPDADSQALVPTEGDDQQGDLSTLKDDPGFADFLNKIGDYATAQSNSPEMWERRRKSVILRKYILGYFCGIYDKQKGFVADKTEGDGIYFDPQTPTVIDNLLASLIKTKPQKKCEARNPDRVDKKEAARVAESLLQMDDDMDFTPKRQQREWKWNLLAAGETYRITYFNTNKQGYGVDEDVFEQKTIGQDDGDENNAAYCALCDTTTTAANDACPNCKNPQLDKFNAQPATVVINRGTKFRQIGDVDWDVPDALEMTVIGDTDDIAEALIAMRDRMLPRCVLEDALDVKDLPDTDVPDSLSYKQLFSDDSSAKASMPAFQPLHYQEFWVAPSVLASYVFPGETSTKGGTIKASTKGKELFPNGLYFTRVKKRICDVFPQAIGDVLSHTVNSVGEKFHGQGEWDLIELQDQATEAKSMKMNSMLLDSTQPLIVRTGYVDMNSFENKFGLVIPAEDYPLDRHLEDMMTRVKPGQAPAEAYQLGEEIKGQIQQRTGTFSTQSDAPDVKAMGTATGIDAITEQATGRRGPALALYAQMEVDQAYQKLELRQKYWCKKMYQPIAKELGGNAIDWFMNCNIRQDINIAVVPGSWMPRTQTKQEEGLQKFLTITGPMLAAKPDPKMMDDVVRQANELFGAGLDLNDYESQNVEAQLRIDKLSDVADFAEQQFGQDLYDQTGAPATQAVALAYEMTAELLKIVHEPTDAQDIFASLPLDVMFDTHSEFEEAYTDWLRTADGHNASQFLRTLIRQLADYHVQAEAYRQYKLNQYQNLTQLPDLQANLVANDATHSQALEQGQQTNAAMPQSSGEPSPMQKVVESINYKDLPPDGQKQLAAMVGLNIAPQPVATPPTAAPMPEDQKLAATQAHETNLKAMDLADKQAARDHDMAKLKEQQRNAPPAGAPRTAVTTTLGG